MLDIGWSELLVVALVAIIVVGPKDLPRLMATFGRYAGKARRMAADFQRQFEESVRESEIEEMRASIESVRASMPVDRPVMLPKTQAAPNNKTAASRASPAPGARPNQAKPRKAATAKPEPKLARKPAKRSPAKRRPAKAPEKRNRPKP